MDNQNNINNTEGYQPVPDPSQQAYQMPFQNPDPAQQNYQQPYQPTYQQPYQVPDPTNPSFQPPYQQQQYQQPYQYNPQQYPYTPVQNNNSNTLGITSIVFSGLGIFCCGGVFGLVGIILGIIAIVKNKKSPLGWIGLGVGILSVVLNIISIVTVMPQMTEIYEEAMKEIGSV